MLKTGLKVYFPELEKIILDPSIYSNVILNYALKDQKLNDFIQHLDFHQKMIVNIAFNNSLFSILS